MEKLHLIVKSLQDLLRDFLHHVPNLVAALLVVLLTYLVATQLSRGIVRLLARSSMRASLKNLFVKLVSAAIWTTGLTAAATILFPSITPARLFTVLGVSSVAFGFAFKDIFENFMAGIVILVRDVIEIGDIIEIEGIRGRVEYTSVRDTHVRSLDGERIIIPNAFLFKNRVAILTDQPLRRCHLEVGVAYDSDLDRCQEILADVLSTSDSVSSQRDTEVVAKGFGPSSIDFSLYWWSDSAPLSQRASISEVLLAVKSRFDSASIEIPFPQRTLSFGEPIPPVQVQQAGADS